MYNYIELPSVFNVNVVDAYFEDDKVKHRLHLISRIHENVDDTQFHAFVVGGEEFSLLEHKNNYKVSGPQDLTRMNILTDPFELYISEHDNFEWSMNWNKPKKQYDERYVFLEIKDVEPYFYIPIDRLKFC